MPDPSAASRVVWALRRAFLTVENRKDELMRGTEVTPAQYAVLMNVNGTPGITGAALARRLRVSPQNVSVLTSVLAERGLLERRPSPHQERVLELHLTRAGRAALDEADAVVSALEREVRSVLGQADARTLVALLERVAAWEPDRLTGP